MTISSAVPASQACRMEDKRERDVEKIISHYWEQAVENVMDRLWGDPKNMAVAWDWFCDTRPASAELGRDHLYIHQHCDSGLYWDKAMDAYLDYYLEEHRDVVEDECFRLEASNE